MKLMVLVTLVAIPCAVASAQQIDTLTALSALRDAASVCAADAGALWGRSLCGPIALVDPDSRLVIANDSVPGRHFVPLGGAYVTTLPSSMYVANTSVTWGGKEWSLVMLPLPRDRYARVDLVMHEVFHREQHALGLFEPPAINNQLDQRAGRTWLRLEYRALASALEALPDDARARHHVESALLFRAERRSLYPGSDSLENALEIQEGLAEYTGQHLALIATGEGPARVARYVRNYETSTPTFVRAFAYGTGPAIGVLLDHFEPSWRTQLRDHRDISALLAQAIYFRVPRNLAAAARARAGEYGFAEIDRQEAARDSVRAPAMRAYRSKLVDGPTITLRQSLDSFQVSFDPTNLVGYDLTSTIYPAGQFAAPWGRLVVDSGGALVQNDFRWIRVGINAGAVVSGAREVRGDGWTLTLNPGWVLVDDPTKKGSYVAERASSPRSQ